jgi:hypothetical protein
MEFPTKISSFIRKLLCVFEPSSVSLTLVKQKNEKSIIEEKEFFNNSCLLKDFLYSKNFRNAMIKEIKIVTSPGTIRVASEAYSRQPAFSDVLYNKNIDILACIKPEEIQQVILSDEKLTRNGSNIKPLPIEELRKKWNENSRRYRIPMPSSVSTNIQKKFNRSTLSISKTRNVEVWDIHS